MTANVSAAMSVAAITTRLSAGDWGLSGASPAWSVAGTSRATAAAAISVSGTSAHHAARQPKETVNRPPSSGPTKFETPALAPQIPSALPRRSGGKPLTAPASAAGLTSPAPAPWMTRVVISAPMLDVSAPAPAPTPNTARPTSASRRAPNRSTSAPAGSNTIA